MSYGLSKRIEEVAEATYLLSDVLSDLSIDHEAINKARIKLFSPAAQQQEANDQAENVLQQSKAGSEDSTQISAIINYIDSSSKAGLSNFHILSHVYGTLQKLLPC